MECRLRMIQAGLWLNMDEEQKQKLKTVTVKGKQLYMDGFLRSNLDQVKIIIKKDWDMIFLYDGFEGSGKSVIAMQNCYYYDPSFNLDRVCFNPREFSKVIKNAKPYTAVLYDEAYTGLSSRAAMSVINRTLVKMLAEIRQKRLFVGIVMPTFFDLDKYVALWRSRALIHVYTGNKFQRGFFQFFNMDRKKQLYVLGKRFYSYYKPPCNFKGRFTNTYVVDEAEYRKKKKDSLTKRATDEEKKLIEEEVRNTMFLRLVDVEGLTIDKKAEILGMTRGMYYYKMKNYEETGEAR